MVLVRSLFGLYLVLRCCLIFLRFKYMCLIYKMLYIEIAGLASI
ncbi:hypothetical protein MTATph1_CDS0207 [Moorella phage MTATph1]